VAALVVTSLYTALSLFCWRHLLAAGLATHMYDLNLGDVGQRVWFMGWLPFAIGHHTNPLVSSYMFAPHGFNLLANASVLLQAFLLAPVTVIWSPVASFNVACIAAPVVSALSLYYVLRRYDMHRSVAFVGGLAYGFSPALLRPDQIGDLNLSWMFFPPLAAYLVDRIFFRQTGSPTRWGVAVGLLVVAQFFSGQEVLLDCVVVVVPVLVVAVVANPRQIASHLSFAAKGTATASVTAGLLLAYPLRVYFAGPGHVPSVNSSVSTGAAVSSSVWPSTMTGSGYLQPKPGTSLLHLFDTAFIGPVVVVLALAALAFARRHRVILLLWAAALWCLVLSWGGAFRWTGSTASVAFHSPARVLSSAVPILRNIDWDRISILTDLLLVMLAAITLEKGVATLLASGGRWRTWAAAAVAVVAAAMMTVPLLVASYAPFAPFESVSVPSAVRLLAPTDGGSPPVAVVFPASSPWSGSPLAWQAMAGFPYRDAQGYAWHPKSGSHRATVDPPGALFYLTADAPTFPKGTVLTAAQRDGIKSALVKNQVTEAVVIDGYAGSAPLTNIYDQVLGPGVHRGDGEFWEVRPGSTS
jgi:hypothetical protein